MGGWGRRVGNAGGSIAESKAKDKELILLLAAGGDCCFLLVGGIYDMKLWQRHDGHVSNAKCRQSYPSFPF